MTPTARPSAAVGRGARLSESRWFRALTTDLGPQGLPRAAVGAFPYPHRTIAEIDEERNRRAILRSLGS